MTQDQLEESRSAYSAGLHFQAAGELCFLNLHRAGIAMSTNLAFACELYLKAALIAEGSPSRGHLLQSLFGILPDHHKITITEHYKNNLNQNDINLIDTLNEIGNSFEKSRYVYENSSYRLRYGAIGRLANVLRDWGKENFPHFSDPQITVSKR